MVEVFTKNQKGWYELHGWPRDICHSLTFFKRHHIATHLDDNFQKVSNFGLSQAYYKNII